MSFFVHKLEWENGEKYGFVYYPQNLEEFQVKLQQLETQAIENEYPFYVEIFFIDDSYIGIIVGHELSCLYFGIFVSEEVLKGGSRTRFDLHYDELQEDNNAYIEYSFKGDHGEKLLREMLPKKQVFDALYKYIKTQKFPSYILFTREEFVDKYIE